MATQDTGYKYVKYAVNGETYYDAIPNTGQVPQGQTEVDYNTFRKGTIDTGLARLNKYKTGQIEAPGIGANNIKAAKTAYDQYGGDSAYNALSGITDYNNLTDDHYNAISKATGISVDLLKNPSASSGITMVNNVPTQTSAIAEQTKNANDPNMVNIGTPEKPLYVPKGSEGLKNYQTNIKPNIDSGVLNKTGTGAGPNAPKPIVNPREEIANINTGANATQDADLASLISSLGTKVDVSESSKIIKALTETFSNNAPSKSTLVDTLNNKRAELGVGAKETELAGIDSEIAKLDAEFSALSDEESNRKVSVLQINRRKTQEQVLYEKAKNELALKRNAVVNELNQKYSVIDTLMKYTEADYDNAQQDYSTKFNQAIALTNLIKGISDDAKTDADKKTDNARANIQVMMTTLKDKNVDYSKLDSATLLDIKNMEIQSGLPSGFTKFTLTAVDEPVVSIGGEFTNAGGQRQVPVYTKNPSTGVISAKVITLGTSSTTSTDTAKNESNDVANAVMTFRERMASLGQKGVDPTIYDKTVAILKKNYGADAVLKLEKLMEEQGLVVDR